MTFNDMNRLYEAYKDHNGDREKYFVVWMDNGDSCTPNPMEWDFALERCTDKQCHYHNEGHRQNCELNDIEIREGEA